MSAHRAIVPTVAGLAPCLACGWPETEGGRRMIWRYGDETLADHLEAARAIPAAPAPPQIRDGIQATRTHQREKS